MTVENNIRSGFRINHRGNGPSWTKVQYLFEVEGMLLYS